MDKYKVVVVGGGTGLSVMLRGLKELPLDLTAIVTVADDGGSSGILRSELQIPPPGDIRNVIIALADVEPMLSKVMQHRFQTGAGLAGHSLGNLILAAMKDITGDFVTGIQELSRVLAVRGRVLPSSKQAWVLHAEMEDGSIVSGESNIPKSGLKIRRVFHQEEQLQPLDEALTAISEADAIVMGPGSLYTSVIPNLLVPQLASSIKQARAVKLFICNVMTQPGETDHYSVYDHLQAIEAHAGGPLFDAVMVNSGQIPQKIIQQYAEQGAEPVLFDRNRLEQQGYHIIADRVVQYHTYLRHDSVRLSQRIYQLIEHWFREQRGEHNVFRSTDQERTDHG